MKGEIKTLDEYLSQNIGGKSERNHTKKSKSFVFEVPIYHDVWMDNALENFYRILKKIGNEDFNVSLTSDKLIFEFDNFEGFKNVLIQQIKHKYKNMIVMGEDKKTRGAKEIKKDFILLQEGKKEGGTVKLKEEVFDWNKLPKILDELKENKKGDKICIMCGGRYKKSYTLKQAIYPFVTKNKSLSGIRTIKSLPEYHKNLCLMCYLLGVLEWTDEGLLYHTLGNEKTFLFLPIFEDLIELNKFKEETLNAGILNISGRYGNLLKKPNYNEIEKTSGEYTTLLAFYEKFIVNVKESEILCNKWGVLHIPIKSKVKNVKFETINVDKGMLEVIGKLVEENYLIYDGFVKGTFFKKYNNKKFTTDWDFTHEIRENLSKSLLINDFRTFSKQLMPRKGGFVILSSDAYQILDELIYLWRLINMGIPKEKLDTIKSVGNIIAKISLGNSSLLYKLDKVRTIEEFWSVLREISRKMAGMEKDELREIKPTAIDELIVMVKEHEKIWKEIRDLLVIYSSMYLAIKKLKKEGD
ncbi:hypothetical protein [Methanotorris formicicus]|uniref:Uncharacterized protein n=1 Tax=Methanotorris formicicus Mc-S-70 TaxID=647171 RepID=H1KWZ9_9EURY|nr:hypothetical protein [Methanotorris formicicus]EHP88825.1 hypothetical protein MetfoDRAFT_0322 [Methanotorris formicicus Mc-S-70]